MASLNIKITKDIYERSKYCGFMIDGKLQSDCAIQACIKHVFTDAVVDYDFIYCYSENDEEPIVIDLPDQAGDFIKAFDKSNPSERASMKEFQFSIDIPDAFLKTLDITEINDVLITNNLLQPA